MSALPVEEDLTTAQAASLVNVAPGSIRVAIHHGHLPASKRDGIWLLDRHDVLAWHARTKHVRHAVPPSWERTASLIAEYGSASADELSQLCELHPGNVRKHLAILSKQGRVHRLPDGQWTLTTSERQGVA